MDIGTSKYQWRTEMHYNPSIDTQSYGECYGCLRRCSVGSMFSQSISNGSRSTSGSLFPSYAGDGIGIRGCNEN